MKPKIKKTKAGLWISAPNMGFIKYKGAFYEPGFEQGNHDSKNNDLPDTVTSYTPAVTASEARRIVADHDSKLELDARLEAHRDKHDELLARRNLLYNQYEAALKAADAQHSELIKLAAVEDTFLTTLGSGLTVTHLKDQIKIGCNYIPIALAKKMVGAVKSKKR